MLRIGAVVVMCLTWMLLGSSQLHAQTKAVQKLLQDGDDAYARRDFAAAAEAYDRAIAAEPRTLAPKIFVNRAFIYLLERRYQDELDFLTGVADKVHPEHPLIQEQKAVVLFRLPGRKREAVVLAEQLVASNPETYTLQVMLGEFYYQEGTLDRARESFEAYLKQRPSELAPGDKLVRLKLGRTYLQRGDHRRAAEQLEAVLRENPDARLDADARDALCQALPGLGDWDRAVATCERVVRDSPRPAPAVHGTLARAYLKRDRPAEAQRAAQAYIALRPADHLGYLILGRALHEQKRWAQAELQLRRASAIAPKDTEVAAALGRAYLAQGAGKAVAAAAQLAIAAGEASRDHALLADLAAAQLAAGTPDVALRTAEQGLAVTGGERHIGLLNAAGDALAGLGDLDRATASYARILDLDGRHAAKAKLVHVLHRQAELRVARREWPAAEQHLRSALDRAPQEWTTLYRLGLVELEQGKYRLAVASLQQVARARPGHVATIRLLARAHAGSGEAELATSGYQQAEALAQKGSSADMRAEISLEWAHLLLAKGQLDDAISKLERAIQLGTTVSMGNALRRLLALASLRRAQERVFLQRRPQDAVTDLERALRDPSVLQTEEASVLKYVLSRAYLEIDQPQRALSLLEEIAHRGEQAPWLKAPLDRFGLALAIAYANYRIGSRTSLHKAAVTLGKLGVAPEPLRSKVGELLAAVWLTAAAERYAKGAGAEAQAMLKKAEGVANVEQRRVVDHNRAVLSFDRPGANLRPLLERLGSELPEALVNLGLLADQAGDSRRAYELWKLARTRGLRERLVDDWISAKQRIWGYR